MAVLSALALFLSLPFGNTVLAKESWPTLALPDNLATFPIGEQITFNGLPMRLQGFVSPRPRQELLEEFRRRLGQPLVQSESGGKIVLGRAQGDFYITVQLEAGPSGNRIDSGGSSGTIAITNRGALARDHERQRGSTARWLDRLPAGSSIASDMTSEDQGKSARHVVIVNSHHEHVNRDALIALMTGDGYQLEREPLAGRVKPPDLPHRMAGATTLHFSGTGKEAMAVIARSGPKTSVVLNTVTTLQAFK